MRGHYQVSFLQRANKGYELALQQFFPAFIQLHIAIVAVTAGGAVPGKVLNTGHYAASVQAIYHGVHHGGNGLRIAAKGPGTDDDIFGGMWDYLLFNENKKPVTVLEMKTTKRAEDWAKDIPEYYALQAALYAYLLGVDDVIMVASFLSDKDYKDPAQFIPSAKNTITVPFKVSERYPEFKKLVKKAEKWWKDHVETGISPAFDEKADAEILKELRTNTLNPESDIEALLREGEELKAEIDRLSAPIEPLEKRLKVVTDIIKQHALAQFRDGDKKVSIRGEKYEWNVSRSETSEIDKDGLKADGLLAKYTRAKVSYRITTKAIEEEA